MANLDTGPMFNEIGGILAEDREYPLNGTLLYAEVAANRVVALATFKNRARDIVFRWFSPPSLTRAVLAVWAAEEPGKRWAAMEYVIRGGKFDVGFSYPEDIDPNEDGLVRRDRAVRRIFGDKPIVYPAVPKSDGVPMRRH